MLCTRVPRRREKTLALHPNAKIDRGQHVSRVPCLTDMFPSQTRCSLVGLFFNSVQQGGSEKRGREEQGGTTETISEDPTGHTPAPAPTRKRTAPMATTATASAPGGGGGVVLNDAPFTVSRSATPRLFPRSLNQSVPVITMTVAKHI